MDQIELPGPLPVTILVRRSARARRLSLRVSQLDGRVSITLPMRTPIKEAQVFAIEKEQWIRSRLAERPNVIRPEIGGHVLYEGNEVPIIAGKGRTARFEDGQIIVPDNPERVAVRVAAFLKLTAKQRLQTASTQYANALGASFGRISIRDTRSRWGSCSSDRNLMYSWRLIMAPPAVLNYVAAHEVSHLLEMNHSPDYWRVVASIYPDYKEKRNWLRQNSQILHRYKFTD